MSKVLGISLGLNTDVFELMRAYGIKADYLPPDSVRGMIGFPTLEGQFTRLERKKLKDGSASDYFGNVQRMPEFWKDYIEDSVVFLADPVRKDERISHCASRLGDVNQYDAVAITALDNYHKPLESMLSYLDETCKKPVIVGGQIVRDSTIPFLKQASSKALFNKGSLGGFSKFLKGTKPSGSIIEGGWPLRIESGEMLMKAGYAIVGSFNKEVRDSTGVTYFSGEPYAHFKVMGISGCGNGCGYCHSPQSLSVPKSVWLGAIEDMSHKERKAALEVIDDNCFKHTGAYEGIFSKVYEKFDKVKINTYLDPQNLIANNDAEKLLESIISSPKTEDLALFIGRECTDESGAKSILRKYNGKIRSQEMLDGEKEKIKQVIRSMDKNGKTYVTRIGYVLGPGSKEDLENIKAEAMEFKSTGKGNIQPQIQPLFVYPGTECHRLYEGKLMSPFPGVSISNLGVENILDFEKFEPRML